MSINLKVSPVAKLPTRFGNFNIQIFKQDEFLDHALISIGNISDGNPVLCRIHSECLTGDAFGSLRCDCGFQLEAALKAIYEHGRGALLYLRQEGRGIGLFNKICAYKLQDGGLDTVDANVQLGFKPDLRNYEAAAEIMKLAGFSQIILMTNNPEKIHDVERHGITVVERRPLEYGRNKYNENYLETKAARMGHLLHHQD